MSTFTFTPLEYDIMNTLVNMTAHELGTPVPALSEFGRYSFFDSGVLDGDGIWSQALIEETGSSHIYRAVYASLVKKGFLGKNAEKDEDGHWTWVTPEGIEWLRTEVARYQNI